MIRVALYEKKSKTLKIKFDYNKITIGKIKQIPGRTYKPEEGKIWTIPYKHIKKLINMFDESELILEDGVNVDYEEEKHDYETEIKLLSDDKFKKTVRYIIHNTQCNTESCYDITDAVQLAHAISTHRELSETDHDIILSALIIKEFCFDNLLKDNYDSLDTDIKYVYNMHWNQIVQCVKTSSDPYNKAKTKTQKITNECAYLSSYINNEMR